MSGASQAGVAQAWIAPATDAVDRAFIETVGSRYGGGVSLVLHSASREDEQVLRECAPGTASRLLIELRVKEDGAAAPPGFTRLSAQLATAVGTVAVLPAPGGRTLDVKVTTEVFDDVDGAGRLSGTSLQTGVLLQEASAGTTAPNLAVVRSPGGQAALGRSAREAQRGWLPSPGRTRSNRAGGLGSNGHTRAASSPLPMPVASILLRRLAGRLADTPGVGDTVQEVAVGLEGGDAS